MTYFTDSDSEKCVLETPQMDILGSVPGGSKHFFMFCRTINIQYLPEKTKQQLGLTDEEVFGPIIEYRSWKLGKKFIKLKIIIQKQLPKSDKLLLFPCDVGRIDTCSTADKVRLTTIKYLNVNNKVFSIAFPYDSIVDIVRNLRQI